VEILFGEGHQLTPDKMLSQPGQYLSKERVTIVGPKKKMERVGVLGPARKHGQVELSLTDCFAIGIKTAVVRESGDISGTPGVVLESETASVTLEEGVIVAKRHIQILGYSILIIYYIFLLNKILSTFFVSVASLWLLLFCDKRKKKSEDDLIGEEGKRRQLALVTN
jgi:hypothetical protein